MNENPYRHPAGRTCGGVLARDDGLIDVPGAMPIVNGLVEVIEQLFGSLGIPARDERRNDWPEDREGH